MHTYTRIASVVCVAFAVACGDSGTPGRDSANPDGVEGDGGASADGGAVTLPTGLPTCSDEADAMDGEAAVFQTASVGAPRTLLGQGVRADKTVQGPNMMTPGKTTLRDVNIGFLSDNDANAHTNDFFLAFYTPVGGLTATRAYGESAAKDFKAQGELSKVDDTKDIYWRFITEQKAMEYYGTEFTAAAGRNPPAAGDKYVSGTTLAQVFNAALRFRFTKDSTCHIQAITKIMGFGGGKPSSLKLREILKSPKRAQVELYLRTVAPPAQRRLGALLSNNPEGELELRNHFMASKCSLTDLAACETLMQKVEDVAVEQGKAAAAAKIKEADFGVSGTLPRGWMQGFLTTEPVPK